MHDLSQVKAFHTYILESTVKDTTTATFKLISQNEKVVLDCRMKRYKLAIFEVHFYLHLANAIFLHKLHEVHLYVQRLVNDHLTISKNLTDYNVKKYL